NSTLIRLSGKYKDIEELRNLVISSVNGVQIRLSNIADVQDSQKEVEKIARVNQKSAILLQVIKQSDANAVAVSEAIQEAVTQIEEDYKSNDLKLNIADDTTQFTLVAANAVMKDLFIAIILVAVVMLFFLHSF